jgi:hypothetical protein
MESKLLSDERLSVIYAMLPLSVGTELAAHIAALRASQTAKRGNMTTPSSSANAPRAWWREPAWVTILLAICVNLVLVGYAVGRVNAHVDALTKQQEHILDLIVNCTQSPSQK